jgi:hypothetical protein
MKKKLKIIEEIFSNNNILNHHNTHIYSLADAQKRLATTTANPIYIENKTDC